MQPLVSTLAEIFAAPDGQYVVYEGVQMPINGPAVIAHLTASALMLCFIAVMALIDWPEPRKSGGERWPRGPIWPNGPGWPIGPSWSNCPRTSAMFEEADAVSVAQWN
jgi:hypothetical protein